MPSTRAALLVNLGSPASPGVSDVRHYLAEFLGDNHVLDLPQPLRWLLLHGVILPFRPARSAHAYASIWRPGGSPLILTSLELQRLVQEGTPVPVALAMRYGSPSIASVIAGLSDAGACDLLLIPQYPHYAMSSYETVVARVQEEVRRTDPPMRLTTVKPFYDDPGYIDALVESARPLLEQPRDHLLFSFHGVPVRHLRKSDPTHAHCMRTPDCCVKESPARATCYRAQCLATARLFARRAGLPDGRWSVSFQSRMAGEPWLAPHTDRELVRLARSGVRRIQVICPSFTADCLETLEEIGMAGRNTFLGAGGADFVLILCLNTHPAWVAWLQARISAWLSTPAG